MPNSEVDKIIKESWKIAACYYGETSFNNSLQKQLLKNNSKINAEKIRLSSKTKNDVLPSMNFDRAMICKKCANILGISFMISLP